MFGDVKQMNRYRKFQQQNIVIKMFTELHIGSIIAMILI